MKTLLNLFKENYKPCAISPIRSLHESFIYKQGFTQNDIENLLKNNIIEPLKDEFKKGLTPA